MTEGVGQGSDLQLRPDRDHGSHARKSAIVVGATGVVASCGPAIVGSGRLDRMFRIDLPSPPEGGEGAATESLTSTRVVALPLPAAAFVVPSVPGPRLTCLLAGLSSVPTFRHRT